MKYFKKLEGDSIYLAPMMVEDAKLKLQEAPTHNFMPFVDVETGKVCVIYKLKDGKNFGLVEPEA